MRRCFLSASVFLSSIHFRLGFLCELWENIFWNDRIAEVWVCVLWTTKNGNSTPTTVTVLYPLKCKWNYITIHPGATLFPNHHHYVLALPFSLFVCQAHFHGTLPHSFFYSLLSRWKLKRSHHNSVYNSTISFFNFFLWYLFCASAVLCGRRIMFVLKKFAHKKKIEEKARHRVYDEFALYVCHLLQQRHCTFLYCALFGNNQECRTDGKWTSNTFR